MRLSDLQHKNIISIDGKLIGKIIDVVINDEGNIESLIVEKGRFFLNSKNDSEISWQQISKIGDDVIIIK